MEKPLAYFLRLITILFFIIGNTLFIKDEDSFVYWIIIPIQLLSYAGVTFLTYTKDEIRKFNEFYDKRNSDGGDYFCDM